MLAMLLETTAIIALSFPYLGPAADPDDAGVPGSPGRLQTWGMTRLVLKECRWRDFLPSGGS